MWRSVHIFIADYKEQNIFLSKIENLFTQKRITKFFFIRYWLGGPHLRIRWISNTYKEDDLINFSNIHTNQISQVNISKTEYYKNINFTLEGFKKETLPWYEENSAQNIRYERELGRYGNEKQMDLNEGSFVASSKLSLSILKYLKNKNKTFQELFTIKTSEVIITKMFEEINLLSNEKNFFSNCKEYWKKNLNNLNLDMSTENIRHIYMKMDEVYIRILNEQVFKFIEDFKESLIYLYENTKGETNLFYSMIFSQIHMFFNRMGLSNEVECVGYRLIEEQIGDLKNE